MKRPGEQYSVYKNHPEDAQDKDKPKDDSKPSEKPNPPQTR
jgi:hypothetical protein